jgi:transaldolase
VNTAPLATIEAYIAKKETEPKLSIDDDIINGYFTQLSDNGFDMHEVYDALLKDGLKAFEQAFQEMLDTLK